MSIVCLVVGVTDQLEEFNLLIISVPILPFAPVNKIRLCINHFPSSVSLTLNCLYLIRNEVQSQFQQDSMFWNFFQ